MYENYPYWKKNKKKNNLSDKIMSDKDLRITIRFDDRPDLYNKIISLGKELEHAKSKVLKDIADNFFLDKEAEEWRKEVSNL